MILTACKKETTHYTIPEGMKQYFAFKKGSWWKYLNDSTKLTDSTYLTNVIYSTQGIYNDGNEFTTDIISLYFASKFLVHCEMHNGCEKTSTKFYLTLSDEVNNFDPVAFIDGMQPFSFHNTMCGNPFGELWFASYPSVLMNDVVYNNVIHAILRYSYISGGRTDSVALKFYFAKNVGLLKYQHVLNDTVTESWSLKSYHTVQ